MAWTVDSMVPITAANQQTDGRIRIYAGACMDLRALLTPTSDPDEFLLPIGWTLYVMVDGEQVDYWYKSPTGQQWTNSVCGAGTYSSPLNWLGNPWVVAGLLGGAYLLWRRWGKKRSTRRRKRLKR